MSATLSTAETENCETPAESGTRSRHDLRRWRADWHSLNAQIAEAKKTMRAKGLRPVAHQSEGWDEYAKAAGARGEAQRDLHGLRDEATALLLFRASLRGRVHAPKLDARRLRAIFLRCLGWTAKEASKTDTDLIRAAIAAGIGSQYVRSDK